MNPTEKNINLGIVGCGDISHVHGNAVLNMKGVRFSACSDLNESRAKAWAEQYGCDHFTRIIWICSRKKHWME